MLENKSQRIVLVTGGTKGIGLETALRFAEEGDQAIITYGWGSIEEADVLKKFSDKDIILPRLIQADVINQDDTDMLMDMISKEFGKVDIFISNVSFCNLVTGIDDYTSKSLMKSIEYSTWPMIEYTKTMKKVLGSYPRYVIGLSSHGPDTFHKNYDFASITKALMEVFIKYLNYHFYDQEIIFNVVRTRPVITDSLLSTFGKEWEQFIKKFDPPNTEVSLSEVAKVIYMLCSGLMDGIRGQTITADKGYDFADGLQRIYIEMEKLQIKL